MSIWMDHKKRMHDSGREVQLCCWNRDLHVGPDLLDARTAVLVPLRRAGQFTYLFRLSQEINAGKAFFLELFLGQVVILIAN
jgi:hypothetical protein